MIKLLPHSEIDKTRWDDCVASAAYYSVFSLSWYLDATHDNWQGLIKGDYEKVIPLCAVSKLGSKSLIQPVFSRYTVLDETDFELLAYYNEYIHQNFNRLELYFACKLGEFPGSFSLRHFQQLDLKAGTEELLKNYSSNARRILKKDSVIVTEDTDFSKTIQLFTQSKAPELGFKKSQLHRLENLMRQSVIYQSGSSTHALDESGELLASGFFLRVGNRITYLKGASSSKGKACGAMYQIMHHQIKKYAGQPYVLDFGGSNVQSVAQFFKKFGAVDVPYYLYSHGEEPSHLRVLKRLKKKLLKK